MEENKKEMSKENSLKCLRDTLRRWKRIKELSNHFIRCDEKDISSFTKQKLCELIGKNCYWCEKSRTDSPLLTKCDSCDLYKEGYCGKYSSLHGKVSNDICNDKNITKETIKLIDIAIERVEREIKTIS